MDAKSLHNDGPVIAIDWGERTTGIAVSPDGIHAFPRKALTYKSEEELLDGVKRLIDEEAVASIVLGLPLTLQGKEREMVLRVKSFGARLEAMTGIKIRYEDERLSSQFAENKRKVGSRIDSDSLAALSILDNFLAKR